MRHQLAVRPESWCIKGLESRRVATVYGLINTFDFFLTKTTNAVLKGSLKDLSHFASRWQWHFGSNKTPNKTNVIKNFPRLWEARTKANVLLVHLKSSS